MAAPFITTIPCPEKCGCYLELRGNGHGDYYLCPNHPECPGKMSSALVYKKELLDKKRREREDKVRSINEPPKCHDRPMQLRRNGKTGDYFYGCRNYPSCHKTVSEAAHAATIIANMRKVSAQ